MKKTTAKGFYDVAELVRAVTEIQHTVSEVKAHTFPIVARKISIVIDQVTGNFAVRDMHGRDISEDVVYSMFPALIADFDTIAPAVEEPPVAG